MAGLPRLPRLPRERAAKVRLPRVQRDRHDVPRLLVETSEGVEAFLDFLMKPWARPSGTMRARFNPVDTRTRAHAPSAKIELDTPLDVINTPRTSFHRPAQLLGS